LNSLGRSAPHIRNHITAYQAASPLTYRDYLGSPQGSFYGIQREADSPMKTFISSRTRIPNLFFTGQNTNMHGVLGVSISAVMAASELIGLDYLLDKIKKES
jgi:all-trans-retinol 13,14-reductase